MTYMFILKCALKLVPKKYPKCTVILYKESQNNEIIIHISYSAYG